MAAYLLKLNHLTRILIIIPACYFPLALTFAGKDALSVSTLLILLFAVVFMVQKIRNHQSIGGITNCMVFSLMALAMISTLSVSPRALMGPAVRSFTYFLSSLALFLYISNLNFENNDQKNDFTEKYLSITLFMVCIQIIISFLIYKIPDLKVIFNIFTYPGETESLHFEGNYGLIRAKSLVFAPETFGEFIAVLSPIALYKIFYRNSFLYSIVFFILCLGVLFSATRSGIILLILATIVTSVYNIKKIRFSALFLILFTIIGFGFFLAYHPDFTSSILTRFGESYDTFNRSGDIASSINRSGIWNLDYVVENINLLGHGLMPPFLYGEVDFHFHNIFLTILFQLGIIGFIFFFALLLMILQRIFKAFYTPSYEINRPLIFSFIVSLGVFMINELKFEFNRYEAYQQLCWGLFALYCFQLNPSIIPERESGHA
jgi:O-antigen ligase